jgi:hypothetical protein
MLVVVTGVFVLIYVPSRLDLHGSTAAAAASILAHQSLFRLQILVGLISELLFIAVVLVLYSLLEDVGRKAAAAMVGLVLLPSPLAFLSGAYQLATLALLRGGEVLTAFDRPQREALALLLLGLDNQGAVVNQMFWGLWLFPLGWLVLRSGFLPRVLGGWLVLNGLAYVAISLTGVFSPEHMATVSNILFPVLMGEVAFALWLLAFGAREQQPRMAAD